MLAKPEDGVTVEAVRKELDDLEVNYKARRRVLRALLNVLMVEHVTSFQGASPSGGTIKQ